MCVASCPTMGVKCLLRVNVLNWSGDRIATPESFTGVSIFEQCNLQRVGGFVYVSGDIP